jgi:hypothetical protein
VCEGERTQPERAGGGACERERERVGERVREKVSESVRWSECVRERVCVRNPNPRCESGGGACKRET